QSRCYSFAFHKKKQQSKVYRCVRCAVGGSHVQVDVIEDEFQSDPCMLPHRCIPRRWATSTVERYMYERAQEIRKDPRVTALKEVQALMDEFHDYGYEKRRRQIARNVEKYDKPRVTLDDVPERLHTLMDGSSFLKYSSPELYFYYSNETIKAAVDALVADGIHKLPFEELGEHGRLYTIHGICNAGVDVPIFHVLTRNKKVNVYAKVFAMVKQELQALGVDVTTPRIILNFEKAALAGIKKHFPFECVEGCSSHLAQAWERRALALGIKGNMKDVGGIWYKWDKKELRTSNVAETYHKVLRLLVREKYAPLRKTIECIRGSDNWAMCTLRNLQKGIYRKLRKRDIERREKIDRCMNQYREPLGRRPVSTRVISTFCRKMARKDLCKTLDFSHFSDPS
ncbi:hypothetical protein ANCCAN_16528, partial [Ancylostoma caninum]